MLILSIRNKCVIIIFFVLLLLQPNRCTTCLIINEAMINFLEILCTFGWSLCRWIASETGSVWTQWSLCEIWSPVWLCRSRLVFTSDLWTLEGRRGSYCNRKQCQGHLHPTGHRGVRGRVLLQTDRWRSNQQLHPLPCSEWVKCAEFMCELL